MASSQGGFESISRLLIERGASIDQQDKTGRTSLHMAASAGHIDVSNKRFSLLFIRNPVKKSSTMIYSFILMLL